LADRPSTERTIPIAAYIGSYLLRLDQHLPTFGALRRFLREHPALIWALGFPLINQDHRGQFDIEASLPSQRHFSRKLMLLPNEIVQTLLDGQVSWLKKQVGDDFGNVISIDTKHILSWVKENNLKAFIEEGRYDKNRQPAGDPDCKLGCKRRKNQITPTKEGTPASKTVSIGQYYWGYASGVAATKVADVGEFVLAEVTRTFDHADITYFFPLMNQVENRLGHRPHFGTMDAAYDAFYTYDYFHSDKHDGFAAIPLRNMKKSPMLFDEHGLPLCEAGLAMPLHSSYINRSSLVQHQRGRYVCRLLYPETSDAECPISHQKWSDGGCKTVIPTAEGARIRYQLDRDSERYKAIYKQRTAVERIFSLAVNLGIERPKLRNRAAITNQNSLMYILLNLRAMARIHQII